MRPSPAAHDARALGTDTARSDVGSCGQSKVAATLAVLDNKKSWHMSAIYFSIVEPLYKGHSYSKAKVMNIEGWSL